MRVSKVKSLDKKLLSLQATRRRKRLKPPFDCPLCEGFQCITLTRRDAVLIFRCKDCNTREVVPIIHWANEIDYFCLLADKWLAERFGREFERPVFEIEIDDEDRKHVHELRAVTLGKIELFETKGGERLPIDIKDAMQLPKKKEDRAIVNWTDVIGQIIESGEYWSAKEVRGKFVKNQVEVFRTKTMLDKAVEDGIITRLWDRRKYVYGRNIE